MAGWRMLCALCFALVVVHHTQGAEVKELASMEDGYVVVPMHAGEIADANGKIHQAAKPKGKAPIAAKPKGKPKAAHATKPKAVHAAKPARKPPAHPAHKQAKSAKKASAKKAKHAQKKHKKQKHLPVQPKPSAKETQKQEQKRDQKTWRKDVMKYHETSRSKGEHAAKARTPWQQAVNHAGSDHKHHHHRREHDLPHHDPVPGPVLALKPKKIHHPKHRLASIEKTERKEASAKLKHDEKKEEALEGQIQGVELQNQAHAEEHKADLAQKEQEYERDSSIVVKDTRREHQDESKALDAEMAVPSGELGEANNSE